MLHDFISAVISLLATYYFIRKDLKAWYLSLLAITLNSWLYWRKGIYAEMALEGFYLFSTCYGLYRWRTSRKHTSSNATIIPFNKTPWLIITASMVFLYALIAFLLKTYTTSDIVHLDALTTTLSIIAQWLMCYKFIATWPLWLLTDAIYMLMYWHKQLPFHTIQMAIYTIMAIIGFYHWTERQQSIPYAA